MAYYEPTTYGGGDGGARSISSSGGDGEEVFLF